MYDIKRNVLNNSTCTGICMYVYVGVLLKYKSKCPVCVHCFVTLPPIIALVGSNDDEDEDEDD